MEKADRQIGHRIAKPMSSPIKIPNEIFAIIYLQMEMEKSFIFLAKKKKTDCIII